MYTFNRKMINNIPLNTNGTQRATKGATRWRFQVYFEHTLSVDVWNERILLLEWTLDADKDADVPPSRRAQGRTVLQKQRIPQNANK
jgi:hypothetical protein